MCRRAGPRSSCPTRGPIARRAACAARGGCSGTRCGRRRARVELPAGPAARGRDPALCAPGVPQRPERELLQPPHARLCHRLRPRDARPDAPGARAHGGRARGLPQRARRRLRRRRVDGGARGAGHRGGLGPRSVALSPALRRRARAARALRAGHRRADRLRRRALRRHRVLLRVPRAAAARGRPGARRARADRCARARGSRSSSRPRSSIRPARGA